MTHRGRAPEGKKIKRSYTSAGSWHESRQCSGKKMLTKKQALSSQGWYRSHLGAEVNVYKCRYCKKWHIGQEWYDPSFSPRVV
jgi:hypothetical protein